MATNSSNPRSDGNEPMVVVGAVDPQPAAAAADLVRDKVARAYADEPDADQELAAAGDVPHRSKHQQFMYQLGTSGKDLAAIQTEWHNYYQGLPASEKHQVWQEFYASQSAVTGQLRATKADPGPTLARHKQQVAKPRRLRDARSKQEMQTVIRHRVTAGGKLEAKHHVQSLLFGLGVGALVLFIFLFGFFNEVIIAPLLQPSRTATNIPLIVNSDSTAAASGPEVIIPKINVEIPVDYTETSTNESTIENDLQNGVVHYPTTALPGQTGNAAFFGHSSNNIFNQGKYKFAFVLLHTLVLRDKFYLAYNGKMYVYQVISRSIVDPSDVSVLNAVPGQTATATLITCDPPGTSLHRLVVVGQQISPDPSGNTQVSTASAVTPSTTSLPGNGPTLWGRFIRTVIGKIIVVGVVVLIGARWSNKRLAKLLNSTGA